MLKFLFFFLISIFLNSVNDLNAKIQIKFKVGGEIITSTDIENERKYLVFLRPDLKDLSNDEIIKVSENSLIRNMIKKKEIDKVFKDLDNKIIINEIKNKLISFKKVKNENEFKDLLYKANIDYDKIIEKMKYEAFWNELIFQKYNSLIRIDEKRLKSDLKSKISSNKKFEYNISELLFEVENTENINKKYDEIIAYIKSNNFKSAATRYSISNSSSNGGNIGWIKETLLSDNLNKLLKKLKKNQITKPIKYPNGYLLLKINDIREIKQKIDIDRELEDLINFEKNKQLNQFSLLFYKKLKQNTIINEF